MFENILSQRGFSLEFLRGNLKFIHVFFCFTEDISHDDLIIDVDSSFARQLYKKWEKSIQVDIFLL